jgi:hypothetical protein
MTFYGGTNNDGVIFSYNLVDSMYSLVKDFGALTLPVSLISFNVDKSNNAVTLLWQTSQEFNTAYFDIQRSTNGEDFFSIGKVTASGNSATVKNYSYKDHAPIKGVNYYRLKMIDEDAKFTYSKTIAVKTDNTNASLQILPNPARDILKIQINGYNETALLLITDETGKSIQQKNITLNLSSSFSIDIKSLPKGVYTLSLEGKTINKHQKFIKE